jgi:cold shock protein
MPVGTVKFFNNDKGYGFIAPDDGGNDAFVHISAVQSAGMPTLDQNQRLGYELETGRNGRVSAVNLQPADESRSRAADAPPGFPVPLQESR